MPLEKNDRVTSMVNHDDHRLNVKFGDRGTVFGFVPPVYSFRTRKYTDEKVSVMFDNGARVLCYKGEIRKLTGEEHVMMMAVHEKVNK